MLFALCILLVVCHDQSRGEERRAGVYAFSLVESVNLEDHGDKA